MSLVFWVTIVGDSLTLGEPAGPVASDNERQGAGEAADECGGSCAYMPTATGLPVGPEEQVWLVLLQASTIPPPRPSFFEIATSRRGHVRLNPPQMLGRVLCLGPAQAGRTLTPNLLCYPCYLGYFYIFKA